MHYEPEGAKSTRARRASATAQALRATARRWTAERGLAGFTIDALCHEVGVSRRTFFNYFASKESAVIGLPLQGADDIDDEQQFLAARGDLFDDLLELAARQWEKLALTPEDANQLRQVFDREPRLLAHAMRASTQSEADYARLIGRRYGWAADDVRTSTAVQIAAGLMRSAAAQFFVDGTTDLKTLLHERLVIARELFATGR